MSVTNRIQTIAEDLAKLNIEFLGVVVAITAYVLFGFFATGQTAQLTAIWGSLVWVNLGLSVIPFGIAFSYVWYIIPTNRLFGSISTALVFGAVDALLDLTLLSRAPIDAQKPSQIAQVLAANPLPQSLHSLAVQSPF